MLFHVQFDGSNLSGMLEQTENTTLTVTSIPHDVNCCVHTAGCRCGCPKVEQMLWVQTGTVRLCHLLPDTQDKKSYLVTVAGMNHRTKDLVL